LGRRPREDGGLPRPHRKLRLAAAQQALPLAVTTQPAAPPAPRGNLPTTPCDIPPPHGVALLHDNSPPCGNLPLHDSSPSHGHTSPCEHAPSHSNSPPRAFSDSPSC